MSDLPVMTDENTLIMFERMDLSKLKDKAFLTSISTGDPNKGRFLSSTVHGPYNFLEMVEQVGRTWETYFHHLAVTILEKDDTKMPEFLDRLTIEYIEAKYQDIIMDHMVSGEIDDFNCQAGISTFEKDSDPRNIVKTVNEKIDIKDDEDEE